MEQKETKVKFSEYNLSDKVNKFKKASISPPARQGDFWEESCKNFHYRYWLVLYKPNFLSPVFVLAYFTLVL